MKRKALFLLLIFLLNTATGFACVMRMSNHEQEEAVEHRHDAEQTTMHHHSGEETTIDHHGHERISQPAVPVQPLLNETYIAKNDPCCQAALNNFNALAKVAPQSTQIILQAPFIYIADFYQLYLNPVTVSQSIPSVLVDGRRRPPTYPVRIALQSFRI